MHFDVQRDDRPALSWPAVRDPLERVAAVLSEREAEGLVPARGAEGALRIDGFVSRPDAQRSNAAGLHLFVNRRPVRDRLLRHALLDAYRDVLPRGRYPTALLFLDVPPEAVDVNVHPAKWEVRFADPAVGASTRRARRARRARGAPLDRTRRSAGLARCVAAAPLRRRAANRERLGLRRSRGAERSGEGATASLFPAAREANAAALRFGDLRLLGQVLATYLVAETNDGLVLIDQHAAHERVLYEGLRASWHEGGVARQPLLITETVELAPARVARVAAATEALLLLGFEVDAFGDGRDRRARDSGAARGTRSRVAPARHRRFARCGARAARPATCGTPRQRTRSSRRWHATPPAAPANGSSCREQQALLAALDAIPFAPTCPHGRPVAVPIARGELERRFGALVARARLRRAMNESHSRAESVVVVAGPTAAGKSGVAIELALRFGGEIVNADSMQVYRGLDIGTAKPSLADRARVPHHLLDVVPPTVDYNAGRYSREARSAAAPDPRAREPGVPGGRHRPLHPRLSRGLIDDGEAGSRRSRASRARGRVGRRRRRPRSAAPPPGRARRRRRASRIHPNDRRRTIRALELVTRDRRSCLRSSARTTISATARFACCIWCSTRAAPHSTRASMRARPR